MIEYRQNPVTGEWVIIAEERSRRPDAFEPAPPARPRPARLDSCPFCPGNERQTPPEVYAVRDDYATHTEIAQEARGKLGGINELLAQKDYNIAEYYRDRGLNRSAAFYYNEVRRRYPDTNVWLRMARGRLETLPPSPPLLKE